MKINSLNKHPEHWSLEAEHKKRSDCMAKQVATSVPYFFGIRAVVIDVGLKIDYGCQIQKNQGDHEVLVDSKSVTLKGSITNNVLSVA